MLTCRNGRSDELGTEQLLDAAFRPFAVRYRGEVHRIASIVLERESDRGMCQRKTPNDPFDMRKFGFLRAQELSARRRVVEQIPDRHPSTAAHGCRHNVMRGASLNREHRTMLARLSARREFHARDRCDTGQRLPTEAERCDRGQVFKARDLAGRMARQRKWQLVCCDANAIISDLDLSRTARLDRDADVLRARIETVLDQLLDYGSGPFNDFSRRDLIDQMVGQLLNGHRVDYPPGIRNTWPTRIRSLVRAFSWRRRARLTL